MDYAAERRPRSQWTAASHEAQGWAWRRGSYHPPNGGGRVRQRRRQHPDDNSLVGARYIVPATRMVPNN
ncbi:hypothetical protein BQ8482_760001 [Mesorhizobium delmotii]|uniref:Uncharacterized protein n=1 Tax=Mesorhizobium delmotii TaxID=1631247 RepID=A0A2P9AW29_9HYPH|nr:hypothetical protein BQ8482_760001 [Mesorhizobium delmotii]